MERTQIDGEQEEYSELTAIDCSQDVDQTRQEFEQESRTENILKHFGVQSLRAEQPHYGGSTDYSIDLQQALDGIALAKDAIGQLPQDLLRKYNNNWAAILAAIEAGEITPEMVKPKPLTPEPDPVIVPPQP